MGGLEVETAAALCGRVRKTRSRNRSSNRSRHQNVSCSHKWLLNDTARESPSGLRRHNEALI